MGWECTWGGITDWFEAETRSKARYLAFKAILDANYKNVRLINIAVKRSSFLTRRDFLAQWE
jgi:hypothetical protein